MRRNSDSSFAHFPLQLGGVSIAHPNSVLRWLTVFLVTVCVAGCPATSSGDDVGDDPPDAPQGTSTLRIHWSTDFAIPGPISAVDLLTDVRIRMENLQAVVTVSPNDPRTTLEELKLRWSGDGQPEDVVFENAPAGLYTSLVFKLDAADFTNAFEIHGTHEASEIEIEDSDSLPISIDTNLDLAPGADETLDIQFQIGAAVGTLDLSSGGEITHGDPQMATFRAALQQAFVTDSGASK